MAGNTSREPMLDMFIFETSQLLEQLEQAILESEKDGQFSSASINEIFRVMHTIKGSAAMMLYSGISELAHSIEDVFYFIREQKPKSVDYEKLFDLVFKAVDFIKNEVSKIEEDAAINTNSSFLVDEIKEFLSLLKGNPNESKPSKSKKEEPPSKKQRFYIGAYQQPSTSDKKIYEARITFEQGCEMENIRAFSVIHNLKEIGEVIEYDPADIVDNEESVEIIRKEGFAFIFATELTIDEARNFLNGTVFLKDLEISEISENDKPRPKEIILDDIEETEKQQDETAKIEPEKWSSITAKQNYISVSIQKLDKLMDLVGELVISEAMVTRNPEVIELGIDSFQKASRQHRKIITELQDMVMAVRMVPLSATFQKMNRIIRDMSKKLNKEAKLEIIGEETEVDKNIIENISDPLMHMIRNSIDHGLETSGERKKLNKCEIGKITLEARNAGSDVIISVSDDGRGLDKTKIYEKAYSQGLTSKAESELSEREIFSFIFLPGFSMKEAVTEFSGRGVGMDVVVKNIEKVGGMVEIISKKDVGTTINIKIPLTLAIIDGMAVTVGSSSYIIPTIAIKESFRPKGNELITDPDGNEMILIRGKCYPIIRLHKQFGIQTNITSMTDGIILMIEDENGSVCLFADALIGEQQVVVKSLPAYLKKVKGIAGCTLLGDGSISLIIDIGFLINANK
jgi:two-component system chemotaxis sensor kinase CheA